jgi:hypothetical protein
MKRSIFHHLKLLLGMFALLLVVGCNQAVQAQNEQIKESQSVSISTTEEGKIKLKVVQKRGDDETTFEKTYDSYEAMHNDPDLEKYGINKNALGFTGSMGKPQFFFHNGPAQGFWNDDDFSMAPFREMEERMREMMEQFGHRGFAFGFDDDDFMNMDSLVQRFSFKNDNGRFFFNGKEITDMDSLKEAMKDKFKNFHFDFDFGDWEDDSFGAWGFSHDDDDVRVITRAKVMVKSASEEDKKVVGTENMEALELRDISFYPNPSDGRFDVELKTKADSPIQVIIVDDNGNEVFNRVGRPQAGEYKFNVDLTHEGKGVYVMKLIQNDKALTKRVVIE